MKKEEKKTYKINTAKVAAARLVSVKPAVARPQSLQVGKAREIILKLIEAIKRL